MTQNSFGHQLLSSDPVLQQIALRPADESCRFLLRRAPDSQILEIIDQTQPRNRPLRIHWHSSEMERRIAAGRQQPFAKACGLHKKKTPRILDLTAGLGKDAYCLYRLGATVLMYERHPALQALLWDSLQQEEIAAEAFDLARQDSLDVRSFPKADVIFVDPMFPSNKKSAAPNLDMQYLQQLLGPDEDAAELWQLAIQSGTHRIVVKRPPRGARVTLGAPDASFGGGRVVYDVYFNPEAAASA